MRTLAPSKIGFVMLAATLALASISNLHAQGTDLGSIRGNVVDASGSAVPNATVTITDVATSLQRVVKTSGIGEYEANGLKTGNYKVLIEAKGFNSLELSGISLRIGEVARADGHLEVERGTQTVVVHEQASLIQTDSPTVSGTLSHEEMTELPRDSRDYTSFLYLNPSITQAQGSGSFKYLGAQSYGASYSLDGQRSNGGIFGEATSSQPSLESIGELTVMTN